MAIPHYVYFILKIPVPEGVLTLQANLAIAYAYERETLALVEALDLSAHMEACLTESKKVPTEELEIPTLGGTP